MASITAPQLMLAVADSLGAALAAHEMGAIGEAHLRKVMKAEIDRLQYFAESEGSIPRSAPLEHPKDVCGTCGHYRLCHGSIAGVIFCGGWMPGGTGNHKNDCDCAGFIDRVAAPALPGETKP